MPADLKVPDLRVATLAPIQSAASSAAVVQAEYLCNQLFSGTSFWYNQQFQMQQGEIAAVHGLYGDLR